MLLKSAKSIALSLIALLFVISTSIAQETTTHNMTEEEPTEVASTSSGQSTVIQLTDPDLAAADDEEPDCE